MNNLCFMSGLTPSEWAAWVQGIGSILAVAVAAGIALWQKQQTEASRLSELRRRVDIGFETSLQFGALAMQEMVIMQSEGKQLGETAVRSHVAVLDELLALARGIALDDTTPRVSVAVVKLRVIVAETVATLRQQGLGAAQAHVTLANVLPKVNLLNQGLMDAVKEVNPATPEIHDDQD